MTRVSSEQARLMPWYAKAGAASSIVPLSRWVSPTIFALKNGGYGFLAHLTGIDEESLTDQEIESRTRLIQAALRGLPDDSCLTQFSVVQSGFAIPRRKDYDDPVLESFVSDRIEYLNENAGFRTIKLFWCITFEPSQANPLQRKPKEAEGDNTRRLGTLRKTASILETQLSSIIGLRILDKAEAFPFFCYLFNLEPWANHAQLQSDAGLDRQIVRSPVAIEGEHLRVGKRFVQMFTLMDTPDISRPCQFSGLMTLDCDSILCTTWRPKSAAKARAEIDQQEKFISFFKVGVFGRIMAGRDTASLEDGAGARAADAHVDDLSEVIRSLDKTGQGEFSMRLLLAAKTKEQLHDTIPSVHRLFVDARAKVMEESLGNLSAFYAMFPGNGPFNIFPLWLSEDHNARLASVYAPSIGHLHSDDLDSEYLNVFETRTRTPFFQDAFVSGVKVCMILGPPRTGKSVHQNQHLAMELKYGGFVYIFDVGGSYESVVELYGGKVDTRRNIEGEFYVMPGQKHDSGRSFTTPETMAAERANVHHVQAGQGAVKPMLSIAAAERQANAQDFLNEAQRTAIREVLTSTDRVHGFQGLAGTGKTTTLAAIREGAEKGGYTVEGFAPTSKAAGQLREAGIEATTLQSFLMRKVKEDEPASKHLYMLDESSLASTRQMRAFLEKIKPEDRVLVIGDTRQHQGVDAGRPFQQMQEAGMQTSRLEIIMRQKAPELLKAVQHLAANETEQGIALLAQQGRVTQLASATDRIVAIAKDYAAKPENTIIVSPDNKSRQQINEAVRVELVKTGLLAEDGRQLQTLSHRSDMTGPDRTWAAMYRPGDVVQYERGSKAEGIERGSFGVVRSSDAATNRVTVELANGSTAAYDPKRVYGVNVFRETTREFATGDRIQFSTLNKELGIANRDMGTITKMEADRLTVLMDGKEKRSVSFDPKEFRQYDHGYAVTSHSAQGLTTGRVIANIDTDSSRTLINTRLAYVAISRASEDARIYTNNAETLGKRLSTDVTKTAALSFSQRIEPPEPPKIIAGPKLPSIHEYNNPDSRLAAVATAYVSQPERSVILAPDRAERAELTQLVRADLYAQGKLGKDAYAVPVLVERDSGSRLRAESYQPGDKIHFKTGSPGIEGIPHDSEATVLSTTPKRNLISVQIDASREVVNYNPGQLRTQSRESRLFQEETREVAEGERIRFTRYDKEMGVRSGELGTVARIGQDKSMTVTLDSGKTAEVSPEKSRHIDYGYAVDALKGNRAERIIATGNGLTQQKAFQGASHTADLTLYTGTPAPAQAQVQQVAPAAKEIAAPEIAKPIQHQHDFGIGF